MRILHGRAFFGLLATAAIGCSLVFPFEDYGPPKGDPADGGMAIDAAGGGCPAGQKACANGCVAADDPAFGCDSPSCNPCSVPYAESVECKDGACAVKGCVAMRADCNNRADDGCESDLLAPSTCGSCNQACSPDSGTPFCFGVSGCVASCGTLTPCNGSCVDITTNGQNCGGCGKACPGETNAVPGCANAKCLPKCNVGFDRCPTRDGLDAGCVAKPPYYVDSDGDKYGTTKAGEACTPPAGFTNQSGDCNDNDVNAKPFSGFFSATPFSLSDGGTSYDYNCNGTEQPASGYPKGACVTEGTCLPGYVPAPRYGAGVDPYCGSTTAYDCAAFPPCKTMPVGESYKCF